MASMRKHKQHSSSAYLPGNSLAFVQSGKAYFDQLLLLINQAVESIHLQTYIFDDDDTGRQVAQALMAAAGRGVEVFLLTDGYGSGRLSRNFTDALKKSGVHFRFFEPLFKSSWFYFGRRLHHKILVTDKRYALIGGINISNNYNDLPGKPAWLDFSVRAEGPVVIELCMLCRNTWNKFPARLPAAYCEPKISPDTYTAQAGSLARIRRNDWVKSKNEISASYVEMFRKAESHITIMCSYFLPGRVIRKFMIQAVRRGIRVRVITTAHSDVTVSKLAERWLYDWLLRNGIELYEYLPAILHAKIATRDSKWITIGSYNVNDLSAYASVEMNMDINDAALTASMEQELERIIREHSTEVTRETHTLHKNVFTQLTRWVAYRLIRLLFTLTTFYYKRRKQATARNAQ